MDNKAKKVLQMADLTTMGMAMVISIFLGIGLGYWLDTKFHSEPIGVFIGMFLGIVAGFWIMFKTYMKFFGNMDKDKKDDSAGAKGR